MQPALSIVILVTACAGTTRADTAQADRSDPSVLFRLAERLASRGDYKKALAEYGAALQLYKRARDLSGTGRTVDRIARLHLDMGHFETARKAFAASKMLLDKAGDNPGLAELYKNLGVLEDLTGHSDLAKTYLEKAIRLYKDLKDNVGIAHATMNMGVLEESFGRHDQARKLITRALALYKAAKQKKFEAAALNNLAKINLGTGNYLKALQDLNKALENTRKLGLRPFEAKILANLGAVYQRLGQVEKASKSYNDALALNQHDGRQRETARNIISLARLYRTAGNLKKSADEYSKAASILEKIKDNASLLDVQTGMTALLIQQGESEKAARVLERALKTSENLKRQSEVVRLLAMRAMLDMTGGKFKQALKPLKKALRLSKDLGSPESLILACELLSFSYRKLGMLNRAIKMSERSVSESEKLRELVSGDELKTGLFSRFVGGYSRLSSLYLEQYQKTKRQKSLNKAFKAMEMGRARGLLDMIARGGVEIEQGLPPELLAREQSLSRKARDISRSLKSAGKKADKQRLSGKLAKLLEQRRKLADQIRKKYPEYAAVKYPTAADLKKVQHSLGKDELLLEYSLAPDDSHIWAIGRKHVTVHNFDGQQVKRWIGLYRYVLRDPLVRGLTRARRKLLELKLYKALISPVEHRLKGKNRVYISPSGELYSLPFSALKREDGDYLADLLMFSYVPSATVFLQLKDRAKPSGNRRPYLGFGDPVFAPDDDPSKLPHGSLKLPRLPGTAQEVTVAAKAFGDSASVFLRRKAKESTLKRLDLSSYKVIHFATHGLLGPEVAWLGQPALALSCCDDGQDGLLTMQEIFNLKLNADVVILSACNTGRGKEVRGEGVMALTRAFFYAGTPSVVVTLWPVPDQSTSLLIADFAKGLAHGESPSRALAEARNHLRSETKLDKWGRPYRPYEHPFYWAPFVVLGKD